MWYLGRVVPFRGLRLEGTGGSSGGEEGWSLLGNGVGSRPCSAGV